MKILILTFYYKPDLCAGSFRTTAFVDELQKLVEKDTKIEVITTLPNRYHSFKQKALACESVGNVTIRRIKLPGHKSGMLDQARSFIKYTFEVLPIVINKEYDLVFATSSRLFTAFLGSLVARKTEAKLYLDIRDIFTDTLEDVLKNRFLKLLIPIFLQVEKFTIRSACRVNLVSQGFLNYFKSVAPNQKFSFYPNGIDNEFLDYDFTKISLTSKEIILYAGNIGDGQGLDKIVPECAHILSDCEFWIVGDGSTRSKLETEMQRYNISNVRLFDPVCRSELLNLYAQCDYLFLHLNDYPAFKKVLPSKVFEYAATGKPVIAGVAGYARNFIEHNIKGSVVFDPCSVNGFIQAFELLPKTMVQRIEFIEKYQRQNISQEMAAELLLI
ncbi:MAG: glycosyltransferase family 4 protein [Desulfosarcina sp.]|nr:glycosyltransferase family 4 protein [Desulfobacterales bacterium]